MAKESAVDRLQYSLPSYIAFNYIYRWLLAQLAYHRGISDGGHWIVII